MLRILLLLLMVYGAVAILAFLLAERLIFQPQPPTYGTLGEAGSPGMPRGGQGASVEAVPVSGGEVVAVQHLPHPDAPYTLLLSHGNAEDLGDLQPLLGRLREAGFGVLAYDYRGYGRSSARRPSARSATEDLEAVYGWAVDSIGIPPDRLVLHGRSVGTGPTVAVAAERKVGGVVLESPFTSTFRVMTRVRLFPFDRFDNLAHIGRVEAPVLVIHGTRDEVIPVSHGRRLFLEAREPKRALWVEGAGHNDLSWVAGDDYEEALRGFARLLDAGREGG